MRLGVRGRKFRFWLSWKAFVDSVCNQLRTHRALAVEYEVDDLIVGHHPAAKHDALPLNRGSFFLDHRL